MPSATPRNNENVPSVTISAGSRRREITAASSPPPRHPPASAMAAAAGIGSCRSRHAAPKQTAASPIMAPTDKSMPPVIRIGVSATASSPSSAFSRAISNTLASVKKFGATTAKIATSATSAAASAALCPRLAELGCIAFGPVRQRIGSHRNENNRALNRAFPVRAHAEKCQRRPDRTEQDDAEDGSGERAPSARNGGAADHDGRDHFQLETEPGVRRHLIE